MPKQIQEYSVFISSPSDVARERETIQGAIEQLNLLRGPGEDFRLTPIRWETHVSTQFGNHPQNVINEQIGDNYDIFVGVLCSRFGQPTQDYASGTEEEFSRAMQRRANEDHGPEVLFYFKDPRSSEHPIDAEQLWKLHTFKESISDKGIYEEFSNTDDLRGRVTTALVKAIDRIKNRTISTSREPDISIQPATSPQSNALIKISDFDEDAGIIDLTEAFLDDIEAFCIGLETIGSATKKLVEKLDLRSEEINKLKPTGDMRKDQKNAKTIVDNVAAELQRYCHILDRTIPDTKEKFSSALLCMKKAIIISRQDGMTNQQEISDILGELETLRLVIQGADTQAKGFRDAISEWPRMSTKLNQAKRRTISTVNNLLVFTSEAANQIDSTQRSVHP
ncbi:MAG: DUF4062 domain-containing protein [Pelagimonas sp.]|jgi:hypothetical protein|nr:DUF4062 domain-containing protein [Pelagimonas sp.]